MIRSCFERPIIHGANIINILFRRVRFLKLFKITNLGTRFVLKVEILSLQYFYVLYRAVS